jgi:hypothetical protein
MDILETSMAMAVYGAEALVAPSTLILALPHYAAFTVLSEPSAIVYLPFLLIVFFFDFSKKRLFLFSTNNELVMTVGIVCRF